MEPHHRGGSLSDAYHRVWTAFLSIDRTTDGRHDSPVWRAHSAPYAACIVRVAAAELQPSLAELQSSLRATPGVRVHPDYFLHIMLQELGFIAGHPNQSDEISADRLEEFAQSAVEPISATAPFTIELGRANSFQDAVFLEIDRGDAFARLHERLFDLAAIPRVPEYAFLPHCTVAHYDGAAAPRDAVATIEPLRKTIFGTLNVIEIEIVTLDPSRAYPELRTYAAIPLGG